MATKVAILILLVPCIVYSLCSQVSEPSRDTVRFDGVWWLSTPTNERLVFLDGYLDCSIYDSKRGRNLPPKNIVEFEEMLTSFYTGNESSRRLLVGQVLHGFRATPGERPTMVGDQWTDPHVWYDGTYWKQPDGRERLRFVQGYLSCLALELPGKRRKFSKSASEYVRLISDWYRLNEETGDIDAERETEKVANVLNRFRDPRAKR